MVFMDVLTLRLRMGWCFCWGLKLRMSLRWSTNERLNLRISLGWCLFDGLKLRMRMRWYLCMKFKVILKRNGDYFIG